MSDAGTEVEALEQYVVTASQAQLNGSTFHRGNRDDGAQCGQHAQSGWAQFEAENPLMAVVTYAHSPCMGCFDRTHRLRELYRAVHSRSINHSTPEDIADRLPWEVHDAPW